MSRAPDSPIFAHLASQDLQDLGRIFGRVYVRFLNATNSQNELDEGARFEAPCVRANDRAGDDDMSIEPTGSHVCAAHASAAARRMTSNELLDVRAETGCKARCARCLVMDVHGRVACGEHAPGLGSDSWVLDQWGPIPPDELAEFLRHRIEPTCGTCGASARNCA